MWAARSGGLDVVALTDHDTCAGIDEALAGLPNNLHLIPGIELSTTLDGAELHILGYFIDHKYAGIVEHSRRAVDGRAERVRKILELLRNYNFNITFEEVIAAAEGAPGVLARPHVARAMVQKGYVATVGEAFDRFLGDDGPCFLPTELLHPRDAIALIRDAGGISHWAHPRPDIFEKRIAEMMTWGLRGVECIRPRSSPSEMQFLEEHAKQKGLLVSGGSDWHGSWQGKLGEFYLRREEVAAFLDTGGL